MELQRDKRVKANARERKKKGVETGGRGLCKKVRKKEQREGKKKQMEYRELNQKEKQGRHSGVRR